MACNQWKDEWIGYLYDEIDPQEATVLEQHLESCAVCQETLDALSATRSLLKQSTPPVAATPRVVVLRPRPRLRPAWAFAAGLAAAAAVFVIGLMAGQIGTGSEEQVTPIRLVGEEFSLDKFDGLVTREELDQALASTREDFDDGIHTLKQQMDAGLERDYILILQQLVATEVRTQNMIDSNRRALQAVTYAANPAIVEH